MQDNSVEEMIHLLLARLPPLTIRLMELLKRLAQYLVELEDVEVQPNALLAVVQTNMTFVIYATRLFVQVAVIGLFVLLVRQVQN